MAEVEVGTFDRVAAIAVEAVGRRLLEVGLGRNGSLLTPGEPVWTMANLAELRRDYVDRPDGGDEGFFSKLGRRLAGAPTTVIQLYAELLILNVFPITNVGGEFKVKQVETVLNLSTDPVTLPHDVRAALRGGGVFHGGQDFTTFRWAQIAYLIQFAIHFKGLSEQRRLDALIEPLVFREEVSAAPTGQAAQRQALLYLAFPHFYLPVVKLEHRTAIRDGLASRFLDDPSGDLDVDLARIYTTIVAREGAHVDLCAEPWIALWQSPPAPDPGPPPGPRPGPVDHGTNYEYSGRRLTPAMAARIIVKVCKGQTAKQTSLISDAADYHRTHGGLPPRDPDFFERTLEQLRADGIAVPMTGGMRGIWRIPPLGDEPPPPKSVTLSAEEEELLAEVGIKGVMEFLALGGPTWSHDYDAIAERMIREHAGTMSDKEILEEILLAIAISRHADRYGHS